MKRKVLSVMLCAAMVVSMTACGGSDAKENTASANASVSETEQGEATEQDAQEEEPYGHRQRIRIRNMDSG